MVAFGCSGSGGGGTGTGTGTGNPADSTAFITIPAVPGQLQSVYLTGQGRAQGDLVAIMRRVVADDSGGAVQTVLNPYRRLLLNGYTQQSIVLNVPTTNGRAFDHYNLEVQELDIDNGDGTFTPVGVGQNQPFVQTSFTAYFKCFAGRQTSIAVRLDDSMFPVNNNSYTFDANQFTVANYSVDGNNPPRMNGFLSDYVAFDISNVANQPPFPDASGNATAFYINGDNFALGTLPPGPPDQGDGTPVPFYVLTPIGYVLGSDVGPRTSVDPTSGQSTLIPGTYSLVQPDPRQPLNPSSLITALIGTYKGYSRTIASVGQNPQGFEIIAFPSSHDDGIDDCVLFNVASGVVTNIYFGQLNMTGAAAARRPGSHKAGRGAAGGTIVAYPIAQITDPSNVANQISGTVTSIDNTDVTLVKSGRYTLGPTNLPALFSTSGKFIVYRR